MAPIRSLSRHWRTACTQVPRLPALLLLTVLNLGYFAWSHQGAVARHALVPSEISPASIVTMTRQEGQRPQSQSAGVSAKRSKTPSTMLLEYEDAPARAIAPDR